MYHGKKRYNWIRQYIPSDVVQWMTFWKLFSYFLCFTPFTNMGPDYLASPASFQKIADERV
jgi:hypothetical protein